MKFRNKTDVEAPIDYIYTRIASGDRLEARIRDRGAKVTRIPPGPVAKGTKWEIAAKIRGTQRKFRFTLSDLVEGEALTFSGGTKGMDVRTQIDLLSLGEGKTRLTFETEAKPTSMAARLLVQSARLAKRRMDRRLKKRMAKLAETIAEDYSNGV